MIGNGFDRLSYFVYSRGGSLKTWLMEDGQWEMADGTAWNRYGQRSCGPESLRGKKPDPAEGGQASERKRRRTALTERGYSGSRQAERSPYKTVPRPVRVHGTRLQFGLPKTKGCVKTRFLPNEANFRGC
jgi:hypothetical protein